MAGEHLASWASVAAVTRRTHQSLARIRFTHMYASIDAVVCQHRPKRAYAGDLNEHALYVFAQAQKEEGSVWGGGSEVACPSLAPSIAEVCVWSCRSCKQRAFLVARSVVAPPTIFPCRTSKDPSRIKHPSPILAPSSTYLKFFL